MKNKIEAELYLKKLLINNKIPNIRYSAKEIKVYREIVNDIKKWNQLLNLDSKNKVTVKVIKSGSRAKGDAIKGHSDLDLLLSIRDYKNYHPLKYYYDSLDKYLTKKYKNINHCRVALNFMYKGFDIDLTPALKINSLIKNNIKEIKEISDHYVLEHLPNKVSLVKSNIPHQVLLIKTSLYRDLMVLMKIWRNLHKDDFYLSSFAIEVITMEVLKRKNPLPLIKNIKAIFNYLGNELETAKIYDPDDPSSLLSSRIVNKDKISKIAKDSLALIDTNPGKVIYSK